MEVGEVPKGIRWSAEAESPPKVRIGGVSGRGRGPTDKVVGRGRGSTKSQNRWGQRPRPGSHTYSPVSEWSPPAGRPRGGALTFKGC